MTSQCFIMNVNGIVTQEVNTDNNESKPAIPKEKVMSYEEKSVGSTPFFKCEACPYMALAEDDIKFHLFTVHPDLAKNNGLADNIQIPCPGCMSAFDAEETLRTHLRNHHKMGIKDVKKMIKSLVQIALKNAKLKKETQKPDPPLPILMTQKTTGVKIPQVIEIVPDIVTKANDTLPKGVTFISVDELQKMSTPNFEKVDPKEIIQEASINIVYTNELSTQYVNVTEASASGKCNLLQVSSVTPDLISSIQPRPPILEGPNRNLSSAPDNCDILPHPILQLPKQGRPLGSRTKKVTSYNKKNEIRKNTEVPKKYSPNVCFITGCNVRLKTQEKILYHRRCHQNGSLHCPECSIAFSCIESLHTHLWKTHNVDMELPTCEICGHKTFRKNILNNVHMKIHEDVRPVSCTICLKSFKNVNQLTKHRITHKQDGKSKCNICQREFHTKLRLKSHVSAVHDKIKPFKCSNCDYTAARKEELKLHQRSHTGDKPYSCDQCSYRCSDHNSIRRHKKRHSKECLYKCEYCPYTSIQSTVFSSHMISKHPDITSNNIFRCPYCSYKSLSKDKYILHLSNHTDKEGIQLLIEMTNNPVQTAKPSWTIPSDSSQTIASKPEVNPSNQQQPSNIVSCNKTVNNIPIEVDDCDSQQESISRGYPKSYCTPNEKQVQTSYSRQSIVTDLSKDDNNSDCLISESSSDNISERHQYPSQISLQNISYDSAQSTLHEFLNTSASLEKNLLHSTNANLVSSSSPLDNTIGHNILNNFPIRLPLAPQISVRNNITLKPIDRIPLPVSKVTGPIIKPTQILPVPSSSNSPVNIGMEPEGAPRKKPKISVKSNLILKGPDQVNMFHSQQKMAFKRLEDSERFGLNGPVTFNNLITTQLMQLGAEPSISDPYPQETMLSSTTTPIDDRISDSSQMFNFNQPISVNSLTMLPQPQKLQTNDPSYIKLEATIKQNTQSPSLEKMCNANAIMNNQAITREYKASPPLEDINKNMSEIKNEVKSDAFYNIALNNTATNAHMMDQYLIENIIGEQYNAHLDLSNVVLPEQLSHEQQGDVIEIDDNSDDNKLLPRYDFPLESLYLMNNDFHFLDNEIPGQCPNNLASDVAVSELNRMVAEVPIINQSKASMSLAVNTDAATNDFGNFIPGKKDPLMNTAVRLTTNKINVKNIELMKN